MLNKITIIGSGSWATALVKIFSESQIWTEWLVRDAETAQYIRLNSRNPRYLSHALLNMEMVDPTPNAREALKDTELVIFAVPSAYLSATVKNIDKELLEDKRLAVSIKGFIPSTGSVPSQFLNKCLLHDSPITVIGGPCHAEEIADNKSTYLTVGGDDENLNGEILSGLSTPYLKVIINNDPSGIEYTAILKNIIGIATGIAHGLNYGDNFQAVLVSNAMRETNNFLAKVHPAKRDLFDSAYFGDLLVTAYSEHSRNRTLGRLVGRGIHISKAIQMMTMIAEGFNASKELNGLLKKLGITLPVLTSVYRILHHHANPYQEFKLLEKQLC